ncbi:MAG: hypothetical protein M3R04_10550 [bacterium]|nr:hypothetical protein [bacterium]
MSRGARIFLGVVALLIGALMALIAPDDEHRVHFYGVAVFCTFMAVTCFSQGRVRAFCGSVIGVTVFGLGIWYLIGQFDHGQFYSGSRSRPSIVNAVAFNLVFGLPGLIYAWVKRFGFRRDAP